MFPNDHLLLLIVQQQYQDRLAEAEAFRLARLLSTQDFPHPTLRQRLIWPVGDLLITLGQKLHPAQSPSLQVCEH